MGSFKTRLAIAAGQFYPGSKQEINQQLSGFIDANASKVEAISCVLPHAGYIYSGRVAAQVVSRINIKEKIILLGPNHTGNGAKYSVMSEGAWQTPLGQVKIDSELALNLLKSSNYLENDALAHLQEHSLEVELPILQYFKSNFEIVPIALMSGDLETLKEIGEDIAGVIKKSNLAKRALLVASSDMTHYEPQEDAEKKDKLAIEQILSLDPDKLERVVRRFNISMCGLAPVVAMLSAAKSLGATKAELVKYETSAEATGDKESVVGYAGIIVS